MHFYLPFKKRFGPAFGDVVFDFPDDMIQTSSCGILFNLFVPKQVVALQ
jgi:hypothetical protein